ncbi:MAG: DsbC family protein [Methylococcales bacterium]|nr:DsbC family protein [Methylococcales bacterium]MDD5753327.1 DsbC family protein [Methylococcales bacterium]
MKKLLLSTTLALLFANVHADEKVIREQLTKSMPTMQIDTVKPSPIKGIFEVTIGGSMVYVSDDGKYLLQGRLIDTQTRTDLTEEKLGGARKMALEKLGTDKMIIFKPKIHTYTVSIFTDIDCGYCRKLHSELDSYLAEGIQIQYLFYPRAGKGSESYNKAVSVWCAKDRNAALTAAKKDQKIESKTCENPIDEHMALAADFDVKGTPMIVTDKGTIYPGYLPAKQLLEVLQGEKDKK